MHSPKGKGMGEEGDGRRKRRVTTPDHPPYSEMVQVALRSLSELDGSTASSISSFIVSAYPSLPPAHSNFLPYYLRKLLLSADIIITSHRHPPRFSLPPSPTPTPTPPVPTPPMLRDSFKPRKYYPIQEPSVTTERACKYDPIQQPSVTTGTARYRQCKYDPIQEPSVTATRPSRKLILHLKRKRRRNGDGAGWLLLREGDNEGRGSSSPLQAAP